MDREVNIVETANLKKERVDEFGRLISDKEKKKPILIQNRWGSYKFVRREDAEMMEKQHIGVILTPADPDYEKGTKLALGVHEGTKPGDVIQSFGKYVAVEDIGKLDVDAIIKESHEDVAEYKEKKEKGLLKKEELPLDKETFYGKIRRRNMIVG